MAARAAATNADLVYLAEPDNPTSTALGARTVLELADALGDRTLLVVDGAYAEYQESAQRLATADVLDRRMVWLRTFSKAYGLAGLRVGYALGAQAVLDDLRSVVEYYAVGRVAQQAALAALTATAHRDRTLAVTAAGRAHYTEQLRAEGYTVLDGATNFVSLPCDAHVPADALRERLAAHGVFARAVPVGPCGLLRLTIGPAEQREAVLALITSNSVAPTPR